VTIARHKLTSTGWAATTLTDNNGEFKFAGLTPASYHLTVTAPACERLEGMVTVDGSGKTFFLRLYRSQQPPTPRSDSVVSVQELRGSGKAESAFAKGTQMLQQGDAQGSLAYFQRTLATDPSYYRAYHNLGLAHYQLGHMGQAEGDFQKSIELSNGGYAPSQFALAMVLCEKQEFREAERLLQNGLTMEPGSAIGKYFLGVVQFALNRIAEAEKSAQEALWRNANQAEAYILLAKIHERNHNPYAVMAEVAAYLKLDPHGPLEVHLQALADRLGIAITVCHYPPGTSKWNKVEHRLFSFISMNWRGQPLLSYETVVNLIGATTTKSGLWVKALLDTREYEPGQKIADDEMQNLRVKPHGFHGDWNYTVQPRRTG